MAEASRKSRVRRESRGLPRKSGAYADWGSADAGVLQRAIAAAALTGGALRFGYSRDGGAYAVGIYGDGEPYTEYLKPSEDLDSFLADIEQLFENIADEMKQPKTD